MYIDSHTHLNTSEFFKDWKKHIDEFEKIWWKFLINAWADHEYNKNWIEISKKYIWGVSVKCTVGFHPYEIVSNAINEWNFEEEMENLKNEFLDNKEHTLAIWETWIDKHYKWNLKIDFQKKVFGEHCKLAEKLNIPLVIHSRDGFDETIDVLKDFKKLKIYFHCRWYSPKEIKILDEFWFNYRIWFCGNITYPKTENIRESLKVVNIDRILMETDAPYLAPQEIRWKTNFPKNVKLVYDYVSKVLNIKMIDLQTKIEGNFWKFYLNK